MSNTQPSALKAGELVRITVEARYVDADSPYRRFAATPVDPAAGPCEFWLHGDVQARIERLAPAEWPPQPGDVWYAAGEQADYFGVLAKGTKAVRLVAMTGSVAAYEPEAIAARSGPMILEYRRGWVRAPQFFRAAGGGATPAGPAGDREVLAGPPALADRAGLPGWIAAGSPSLTAEDAAAISGEPVEATGEADLHTDMHPQPGEAPAAPLPLDVEGWAAAGGGYRSVLDQRPRLAEPVPPRDDRW